MSHQLTRALLILLSLLLTSCSHQYQPVSHPATFRVMSYNIHHAQGTDGRLDISRIARVILDSRADLAAIQEVDVNTTRVPHDTPAELSRLTGMHVLFAKAIDYQNGAYGQLVLSRFPISNPQTIKLPSKPNKEQRIALAVTVSPPNHPDFRFVTAHLDHESEPERVAQARHLVDTLSASPIPTLLAGDFNARLGAASINHVLEHFQDTAGANALAPTGPADRPTLKIDYILTTPNAPWTALSSTVIDDRVASDHRPVLTDFTWP